jgi:hypothetical protein
MEWVIAKSQPPRNYQAAPADALALDTFTFLNFDRENAGKIWQARQASG